MPDVRITGHVGPATVNDGAEPPFRMGNEAQQIVSVIHGTHYEATKRGTVFILSTVVAGLAVPISTTTAPSVLLWNPANSGKSMVLLRCLMAYVSGTTVGGAIGLSYITGVGSNVATGAPITAFAASTPTNGLIGGGLTSVMKVSAAGTNTISATTNWFYTLFSEYAAVALSAIAGVPMIHDFDGAVIVPPNVAIYPNASAASGALLSQTFIWEEVSV